jgi:hypothetical protein
MYWNRLPWCNGETHLRCAAKIYNNHTDDEDRRKPGPKIDIIFNHTILKQETSILKISGPHSKMNHVHFLEEARTVYYHSLSKCMPDKFICNSYYDPLSSSISSFFHQAKDTLKHLLVECPPRQIIWHRILSRYFPYLIFTTDMLYDSLRSLKHSKAVQSSSLYLPVISTILW